MKYMLKSLFIPQLYITRINPIKGDTCIILEVYNPSKKEFTTLSNFNNEATEGLFDKKHTLHQH